MSDRDYAAPPGGLPGQDELLTGRAAFTEAYAVIPKGVMRDIVVSYLPFWERTRAWVLARPLSGFAETFSHYLMEVEAGGGSHLPDPDRAAQGVIFLTHGSAVIDIDGAVNTVGPGSYAYLPPGAVWNLRNEGTQTARFHWIRKAYDKVEGIDAPPAFIADESEIAPVSMPDTDGRWSTTRFVDPQDMRHDMHVNIVNFEPGAVIPFAETHVMEHGIYILQGKAVYRLNRDWVEVEAGDFLWLRAFCPQACYAGGPGPFRYLLYKDVNRHARLR